MESKEFQSLQDQDFVEYYVFPDTSKFNNKDNTFILDSVLERITNISHKFIDKYIWHKDEFKLTPKSGFNNEELEDGLPLHLYGLTQYGDNIEDEWFIVYLLFEFTRQIKELVVRVIDADGEFILIEAANHLPKWATPETCSKRVYIYEGKLHVVPPATGGELGNTINVSDAVDQIRSASEMTVASKEIQSIIFERISNYSNNMEELFHRTKVFLPVGIANILEHNPNLIAPAVLAFCNRDPIDIQACRVTKYFPSDNCVYNSVKFTKFLYAMLVNSKYIPERKSGWDLPPPSNKNYKAHLLGAKIACGFEILVAQTKSTNKGFEKSWSTYLNSLKSNNYFGDLLEHSLEYNALLKKAKDHYAVIAPQSLKIGEEILTLLRSLEITVDWDKIILPEDDSEDWLSISQDDVNKILQERYGCKKKLNLSSKTNANIFTNTITNFLEQASGVDGIEFSEDAEGANLSTNKEIRTPNDNCSIKTEQNGDINFDANYFSCALQNILKLSIPDDDSWNLESDSDIDDYGKEECPLEFEEQKTKQTEYMNQMDAELSKTCIGESFIQKPDEDHFDDVEDFEPIDINVNALKNILKSYKSQMGTAGPSSTMLGPMGVHLINSDSESD